MQAKPQLCSDGVTPSPASYANLEIGVSLQLATVLTIMNSLSIL
jgi:hypothetical protein